MLQSEMDARIAKRTVLLQSDFSNVHVPPLEELPGMITPPEGRYLYWLVSETYVGSGAVVELGCWLGKSTSYLALGMRESGLNGDIHSFDRFVWIKEHAFKAPAVKVEVGGSFEPVFLSNVRTIWPNIHSHKVTFDDMSWSGGDIEILFLDGPKNFAALSSTMKVFGDSVLVDKGILVIQDYLHPVSFVLAMTLDRMGDRLNLLHAVEGGQTASFQVTGSLSFPQGLPESWELRNSSAAEIMNAYERVIKPLSPANRRQARLAPAFLLYEAGHKEDAVKFIKSFTFEEDESDEWNRWFSTGYYNTYPELFHATGLRRSQPSFLRRLARKAGLGKIKRRLSRGKPRS